MKTRITHHSNPSTPSLMGRSMQCGRGFAILMYCINLISIAGCTDMYGYGQNSMFDPYGYNSYGYPNGPNYYGEQVYYQDEQREPYRAPISDEQKELNYINDHRREIANLPPQEQKKILKEAKRAAASQNQ